eukprot:996227-Ditylum_brightwellii.AAC.1
MEPTNHPVGACISALNASLYFPICFGFSTVFCTFGVSSKITKLMMCVAFSLRLYLLGGTTGIIGASLITGTSNLSSSHGINTGWRD